MGYDPNDSDLKNEKAASDFKLQIFTFALALLIVLNSFLIATTSNFVSIVALILSSFVWYIYAIKCENSDKINFKVLVIVLIITRFSFSVIEPYKEDDYYRYIWDGIVSSKMENALIISPQEVKNGMVYEGNKGRSDAIKKRQGFIDEDEYNLFDKINYPESSSIYGPFSQAFLALQTYAYNVYKALFKGGQSDIVSRILCLKYSLLIVELILLFSFYRVIIECGLNKGMLMPLVLSPLIIKEISNSMHIDILSCTLSVLSCLVLIQKKVFWSAIFLAACCCVKLYGLVLFPIFFLFVQKKWRFAFVFGLSLFLMYFPFVVSGGSEIWTGTKYFSHSWTMNDFFSAQLRELLYHYFDYGSYEMNLTPIGSFWVSEAKYISRYIALGFFCVFYFYLLSKYTKKEKNAHELFSMCSHALFLVYYFSPVQNPWYLIWGLPFFILSKHKIYLFFVMFAEFYLFNFIFDATTHIYHPFQWWVIVPHMFFLIVVLKINYINIFKHVRIHPS